jgi:hypothetical protein
LPAGSFNFLCAYSYNTAISRVKFYQLGTINFSQNQPNGCGDKHFPEPFLSLVSGDFRLSLCRNINDNATQPPHLAIFSFDRYQVANLFDFAASGNEPIFQLIGIFVLRVIPCDSLANRALVLWMKSLVPEFCFQAFICREAEKLCNLFTNESCLHAHINMRLPDKSIERIQDIDKTSFRLLLLGNIGDDCSNPVYFSRLVIYRELYRR